MEFPKNVVHKPLARKIEESSVTFEDISVEEIDEILYCTGALYFAYIYLYDIFKWKYRK